MSRIGSFARVLGYGVVGLLLSSYSSVTAQVEATNKDVPLEVRLNPDKKTIMLGEPLFVTFAVTNLSGEKLCLGTGGDYRNKFARPERFDVRVSSEDGAVLPKIQLFSGGGLVGCEPMEPGATYKIRLFLPHWVTIERPGLYRVKVKRELGFIDSDNAVFGKVKYSVPAEVDAEFTVVPADENKMGGVINALGSVMLDSADPAAVDSATALASMEDKRVISYFAEALSRFRNSGFAAGRDAEYMINSRVIPALAKYDDDQAIAALRDAQKSTSDDVRLLIATALINSPHKSALKSLMKMQNDSYYFVRLRVAQGLKDVKTKEALATLQKLLKDENKDVREAAQASLN